MILVKNNLFHYPPLQRTHRDLNPILSGLIFLFLIAFLSGCNTFVASKQDDLLTQINTWAAENEYGKALDALDYVKESHPQKKQLMARKVLLQKEARKYEFIIHRQIKNFINKKQWAEALDLIDQARSKYSQSNSIRKTEQFLLNAQEEKLADIEQLITIERARWMIKIRPIYKTKLNTDPRNKELQAYLNELDNDSELLAQQLTILSRQAITRKHLKTARIRINDAITLAPSTERKKILSSLKHNAKKVVTKKKQEIKRTHKEKQNTLLADIEKSFKDGNLIKTKQLITRLDEEERQTPELIQLEKDLNSSIDYNIQHLFSDADKLYIDGQFSHAITLWEEILRYEPNNSRAENNIERAEKIIKKLTTLRKKQKN